MRKKLREINEQRKAGNHDNSIGSKRTCIYVRVPAAIYFESTADVIVLQFQPICSPQSLQSHEVQGAAEHLLQSLRSHRVQGSLLNPQFEAHRD